MEILYRGIFVENFSKSENGPKIDGFGGIRQGKLMQTISP